MRTWIAALVIAGGACSDGTRSSNAASSSDPGSGGFGVVPGTGGMAGTGGHTGIGGSGGDPGARGSGGQQGTAGMTAGGGAAGSGGATGAGGIDSGAGQAETGGAGATGVRGGTGTGGSDGSGGMSGAAMPSAGCGKTSTLMFEAVPGESGQAVGVGEGGYVTIQSGGGTRGFALRLPDNYDKSHPYWLIFGFHWNGGNSKEVDTGGSNGYVSAHFGLQKLSNNGAIFVAPQGLNNGWANSGGQDLQFVDDMLELLENNYCVDTTHVITNGFSYGGGMSYAIACARAKTFRAAAIYEGAQISGCDGGNDPIALWQMVGLEDTICSLDLAKPIRDRFVKNNGCTEQDPPQPPMAPPYLNPGGHICTDYEGCSSGHPIRWCVHQSGHGYGIVDGTGDLYNSCATPPKTCSSTCPCNWVAEDVWKWMTAL